MTDFHNFKKNKGNKVKQLLDLIEDMDALNNKVIILDDAKTSNTYFITN